jgi:hypothetical protein
MNIVAKATQVIVKNAYFFKRLRPNCTFDGGDFSKDLVGLVGERMR